MALATTVPFRYFKVSLGNGASPEVFSAPCGITQNAIAFDKDTNSIVAPDCDNPDAPGWTEKDVVSNSASISGSGVLAMESLATWWNAYNSSASINCRVEVDVDNGGYWEGKFHLTRFEPGGSRGTRTNVTIAMLNDGAVVWVPV
jgi:hypothetical protein